MAIPPDEPPEEPFLLPEPDEPSEGTFWQTYSPNLALPIAVLLSVLAHITLVVGLLVVIYLAFGGAADKTSVPIRLVDGGFDDTGLGSAGSGGNPDPVAAGESKPTPLDQAFLPLPDQQLPEVNKEFAQRYDLNDPSATVTVSPDKAAALFDEELRKKLDSIGQKKGNGPGAGKGDSGQPGGGPGGIGADATRARSLRWVLRFKTNSGRDYLDQLQSLGADVVVPVPPDNKTAYVYRSAELGNPKGQLMSEGEWTKLAQQIQFCDYKVESVRQVSAALNVPAVPSAFWAFFPKSTEAEMSRKEIEYQNKRAEDIEETVFAVTPQAGGKFGLVVARQTLKR